MIEFIISLIVSILIIFLVIIVNKYLIKLTLERAGNIISKSQDEKINGIYENGIIINNQFIKWKKFENYFFYFYNQEIKITKKNKKQIAIKFNVGDYKKIIDLLNNKGIGYIDPSS
jgi:hypothetical protein